MTELIELPHDYEIDTGPSVKDIYKSKLGTEVTLDKFLFACLEEERTTRAIYAGKLNTSHSALKGMDLSGDFQAVLKELLTWHIEKFPVLARDKVLDYEILQKVAYQFVHLVDDLSNVAKSCLELDSIPSRDGEPKDLWSKVDELAKEILPAKAPQLEKLLDWTYAESESDEYDLKTLPPIGRFALILRRQFRKARADHQNKQRRGNRDDNRKPRNDKRGPRDDKGDGRPNQRGDGPKKSNAEQQKAAEREAVEACEKMRQDEKLDGVLLPPQNSFIRRLQHKKVNALGFGSTSVGEGPSRAVKVLREPEEEE